MADGHNAGAIYREHGKLVIPSGASMDVESGGALKIAGTAITSSAAEINKLDGVTASAADLSITNAMPASVSFVAAAGGSNECDVTITVLNSAGVAIAEPFLLDVWLSDAATGLGHTGTGASGTVQAKSSCGLDVSIHVAKKAILVQTLATGIYTLEITDDQKTTFYVCAECPGTGKTNVSTILATGDYG